MNRIIIDAKHEKNTVSRHIYGHFSEHLGHCIYGGLFRDGQIREDAITALRDIGIPNLRWPGGCFSDEYHWKDGIGKERKYMVNNHWGKVVEDNSFGTHEFMLLCERLGCEPYINGNLGSGTVLEMQEWVEYLTCGADTPMARLRAENGRSEPWKVKYFGVGNEPWGMDGHMSADYYASLYKRYATYCRDFGDNKLFRVLSGPGADYGVDALRLEWTDTVMREAGYMADGLAIHYYTVTGDWEKKGAATEFSEAEYYITLKKALWLDEIIRRHANVMERHDPDRRVKIIFDEWGTWHDVEKDTNPGFLYQQNTMRDALVAAASLNIFNKRSDVVHMANIAQVANVLQSVILTDGDRLILTPTYYVFKMFKEHQDAVLLESSQTHDFAGVDGEWKVPQISHSATKAADGSITLTVANLSVDAPAEIDLTIVGGKYIIESAEILSGKTCAHNTFESPENVKPRKFEAGTLLPPCSVASLKLRG